MASDVGCERPAYDCAQSPFYWKSTWVSNFQANVHSSAAFAKWRSPRKEISGATTRSTRKKSLFSARSVLTAVADVTLWTATWGSILVGCELCWQRYPPRHRAVISPRFCDTWAPSRVCECPSFTALGFWPRVLFWVARYFAGVAHVRVSTRFGQMLVLFVRFALTSPAFRDLGWKKKTKHQNITAS